MHIGNMVYVVLHLSIPLYLSLQSQKLFMNMPPAAHVQLAGIHSTPHPLTLCVYVCVSPSHTLFFLGFFKPCSLLGAGLLPGARVSSVLQRTCFLCVYPVDRPLQISAGLQRLVQRDEAVFCSCAGVKHATNLLLYSFSVQSSPGS